MTHTSASISPDSADHPPYLARLGLHSAPFLAHPADAFLYQDITFTQRLDLLQHLARFSDLLLVLTGEQGSGKTTLIQQFLDQCEGQHCCLIQAHALLSPDGLLQQIATCLRLQAGDGEGDDVVELIRAYFTTYQDSAHPLPVVIVDDAHELPLATLDTLLKLPEAAGQNGKVLHILLAGEAPITDLLASLGLSLGKDTAYRMELTPLTEEQCARYLQHRLTAAGLNGPSPFTPAHVHHLYQVSGGVPGRLDAAAHQLLLELGTRAEHPDAYERHFARLAESLQGSLPLLRQRLAKPRMWLGAAAVVLVGAILLFQARINALFAPEPSPQEAVSLPLPQQPEPVLRRAVLPLPSQEPAAAEPPSASSAVPEPATPKATAQQADGTVEPQPAAVTAAAGDTPAPAHQPQPAAPEPAPPVENVAAASAPAREPAAAAAAAPVPTQPVAAAAQPAAKKRDGKSGIRRESWLLKQSGKRYTLQLIGSLREATIRDLISRHGIEAQAAYFRTRRENADWYVLLYGLYPDRDAALAAVGRLPKALQAQKPWARTLESVQQDIAKVGTTRASRHP